MLTRTQIVNDTANVYTCPSGKTGYVYVDVVSNDESSVSVTIKIGDGTTFYTYWTGTTNFISVKLILSSGDVVQVMTDGTVNVFVYGKEM
jgi:hypothetical protein